MPQPPGPSEPGPASANADLLTALSALGRALGEELTPELLLDEFCKHLRPLLPHERLTVSRLDDLGQTFTVFAEHAEAGPLIHAGRYTTDFKPEGRNLVADWAIRPVFEGERLLVTDFRSDPRFARLSPRERAVVDAGYRSAVVLPLRSSGRVIGAMAACSRAVGAYGPAHLELAAEVADLIGPFIDSTARLYVERRRRRQLAALQSLPAALAESLNVQDVFRRLADAVRPILDFDVMGVGLLSGREIKILAEVNDNLGEGTHGAMRLEDFSFAARVEGGEAVVVSDAPAELDPSWPGDRMMIEDGARSTLCVPLRFGEQVGGALYFGRREPYWFDPSHEEVAIAIAAQVVLAIYRLNVFPVHLPALRERREDVLLLAEHFVLDLGARMGKGDVGISRDARDALLSHPWPGNIRELQNAVERALIMSDGRLITADQLGLRPRGQAGEAGAPSAAQALAGLPAGSSLAQWEHQLVLDGLRRAGGNKSRAARLLGLTRSQLYTRLKRCGP